MSNMDGKQLKAATVSSTELASNAVTSGKIATSGKQSVLEEKILENYRIFLALSASGTSNTVTDKAVPASSSKKTGGSTTLKGIVNTATDNYCILRDGASNDVIKDGSNRQVFGRLTRTLTALTGTVTFTNGSTAVSGSGTAFTTALVVGDYIQLDADRVAAKVASITDDTNLVLTFVYPGTGGAGAASKVVLTLTYFVDISGTETSHTMPSQTIEVEFPESFDLFDLPFDALTTAHGFVDLAVSTGASNEIVDQFAAETVTRPATFSGTLSNTPSDVTKVKMYVNGVLQRYGAGQDFTVSGTTVSWLATADFDIATTDEVQFIYNI